jgi:hypothetical protein
MRKFPMSCLLWVCATAATAPAAQDKDWPS